MRRSFRVAAFAFVAVPAFATAQNTCALANSDVCQKAEDVYSYLIPQLGLGLAGGNPVLGSGGVIGKLGHFSVGVRASLFKGGLPKFDNINVSETGRVSSNIPVEETWLGAGGADGALGLFRGIAVGTTHVGSLDALVSMTYIPEIGNNDGGGDLTFTRDQSMRFGFGGRVGILDESFAIPGISFAYLQRGLPKVSLDATTDDGAQLGVEEFDLKVTTWRLIATKNFLAFSLTGGFGGDKYKADGAVVGQASGVTATDRSLIARDLSRTNWFIDLSINLGPVKLSGEYGGAAKTDVTTFNTFDPLPGSKLTYYSAGLRIAF